jgi:hypothetical protein
MPAKKQAKRSWVEVNRAPVLTLWAAVVAERLGFNRAEALTLGRAVAGLNAYAKGKSLGIFEPSRKEVARTRRDLKAGTVIKVDLLNRAIPAKRCNEGLRAVSKGKPISPESVEKYLEGKFGAALVDTRKAMTELARAYSPTILSGLAYELYAEFRPVVPGGKKGWGAKGRLSLNKLAKMAAKRE